MATINIPNFTTGEKVFPGINTYTYTIVTTAMHVCRIDIDKGAPSNLTCVISQSGSQSATLASLTIQPIVPSAGNSSQILMATGNFISGDVVTFTLTSSNADDLQLNRVKSKIIVKQGSGN